MMKNSADPAKEGINHGGLRPRCFSLLVADTHLRKDTYSGQRSQFFSSFLFLYTILLAWKLPKHWLLMVSWILVLAGADIFLVIPFNLVYMAEK